MRKMVLQLYQWRWYLLIGAMLGNGQEYVIIAMNSSHTLATYLVGHTECTHLSKVQQEKFPLIAQELNKGYKKGHWIWYVFPTTKSGSSDVKNVVIPSAEEGTYFFESLYKVHKATNLSKHSTAWGDAQYLKEFAQKTHLGKWASIVGRISGQMNDLAIKGQDPKKALPLIDHGRIGFFQTLWNDIYNDLAPDIQKSDIIQQFNKDVQNIARKLQQINSPPPKKTTLEKPTMPIHPSTKIQNPPHKKKKLLLPNKALPSPPQEERITCWPKVLGIFIIFISAIWLVSSLETRETYDFYDED